jgi:hypothetical protein
MTTTALAAPRSGRLRAIKLDERVIWCGIAILIVFRIALSLYRVRLPGLQQDETLFVNAATLRLGTWNMPIQIHGFPLMIFPYIGALKSWIYFPILHIFGDSPTTIRLPVVLITSGGLLLLYPTLRDLVNRSVAIAVVAAMCFENSLFWLTRDDVGPTALEFFLKCLALYAAALCARELRIRWIGLLLAALALGVFNKLNFIWVVNAVTVVSLILGWQHRSSFRAYKRQTIVWVGGLAAIYLAFGIYYIAEHISRLSPSVHGGLLAHTWPPFVLGMRGIISGTWFYSYALSPLAPRDTVVWLSLALFTIGTVASVLPSRTRNFPIAAMSLSTLLIAAQILVIPVATSGWHYIEIYPFYFIVAAYGAYAAATLVVRSRRAGTLAVAGAGVAMLIYSGVLLSKYDGQLPRAESNPGWSSAIYTLDFYVQHTGAQVYSVDWGIANPLFTLHPSARIHELAFAYESSSPTYLKSLGAYARSQPGYKLFVAHANGQTVFPDSTKNLLLSMQGHLRLIHTVLGTNRVPVYLIYALR